VVADLPRTGAELDNNASARARIYQLVSPRDIKTHLTNSARKCDMREGKRRHFRENDETKYFVTTYPNSLLRLLLEPIHLNVFSLRYLPWFADRLCHFSGQALHLELDDETSLRFPCHEASHISLRSTGVCRADRNITFQLALILFAQEDGLIQRISTDMRCMTNMKAESHDG
jgi:hypothetical protein